MPLSPAPSHVLRPHSRIVGGRQANRLRKHRLHRGFVLRGVSSVEVVGVDFDARGAYVYGEFGRSQSFRVAKIHVAISRRGSHARAVSIDHHAGNAGLAQPFGVGLGQLGQRCLGL